MPTNTQQKSNAKPAQTYLKQWEKTLWLETETQIDTVTALSGSGPAYFYYIFETLIEAAQKEGLTKKQAHQLTLQTALGATQLAQQSTQEITTLRQQVTSPGGTTAKGIEQLEKGNLQNTFAQALTAAKIRAQEIGQQHNQ